MRRVRSFTATEEGQVPFDEGGAHANGVFEHLISVEYHRRAEAHPRVDASKRDLQLDAGGVNVRGQAEGVDAAAVHRLEPDRLPDPVRILPAVSETNIRVVEGEAPLAVQVCPVLAAELGTRVLGSWDQGAVPFLLEVRAIRSEGR
jgi:hypothetical protein